MKEFAAKLFARYVVFKNNQWIKSPIRAQEKTLKQLINQAKNTQFGIDHSFDQITGYEAFKEQVPIRDYEGIRPYIDQILDGKEDVLWPGKPIYFSKTSGTTSGAKYIPITKESMPTHIQAARDALLTYIHTTGKTAFINGKQIFLQGSPTLGEKAGIALGRLSGIVAHYVPSYLQKNRMPSWETNCIEDWETKVDAIVEETRHQNMTLIGGIPSWVQMYFERLNAVSGKQVGTLFPNFSLFVYGGVNFEPYRAIFKKLIGRSTDSLEFYPASEGFFAYQTDQSDPGLLLLLDHGIYYEFVKADAFFDPEPIVHRLEDVELGIHYVMIISTTAGLWRYNIGDTIQFTSKAPFKVVVSGRIKHFISAFGEHVIVSEVEQAIQQAIETEKEPVLIREFTVAPQVNPSKGLPFHEWYIEFESPPNDLDSFALKVDQAMQNKNIYYADLIVGKVLQPLKIRLVQKKGFNAYMKQEGKLGGQNKVPRVSDNRKIADVLDQFLIPNE